MLSILIEFQNLFTQCGIRIYRFTKFPFVFPYKTSDHQDKFIIVTCIPIARQRVGEHIPAGAYERNNRTSIARQRISKQAWTIEGLCFLRSPWRGVIKGQRMSFEWAAVEKWVEFWRWQSEMVEKKWQDMKRYDTGIPNKENEIIWGNYKSDIRTYDVWVRREVKIITGSYFVIYYIIVEFLRV
jgi:hypothetical protein